MAVKVEDEWRYKKAKSEAASKSAFAFKINAKLKQRDDSRYSYGNITPYSKEVMVKITGGARSKKGIKNTVEYISENWQNEIIDKNGITYKTKEEMQGAIKILQENAVSDPNAKAGKELKLTQNIVFSAPKGAVVKKEDALKAALETLKTKYPDNYFVAAYHTGASNPHVHIVLNINKDCGSRIDIRKKDLKDLREIFCQNLSKYGYDVKATNRYKTKEDYEELNRENRNIYEVVEFGTESYKANKRNNTNNYLIYKTANNTEVTIWGKELLDELMSKNIKKGDLIRINKTGSVSVQVPVFGKNNEIISWKMAKRNQWSIERAENSNVFNFSKINRSKEVKLDSPQQAEKQLKQREKFNHFKKLVLNASYKERFTLESDLHHKQQKQGIGF